MEHEFHQWLKTRCELQRYDHVSIGIGDDGAVLAPTSQSIVVTTDSIAEGTHFDLNHDSLDLIGRKSLAVNLSDLAAMAARPHAAVLSFQLPRRFQLSDTQELYSGIEQLASRFDLPIIGGDTNRWDGPLVVGATVLGTRSPHLTGWTMGGAQSGDAVLVSGSFGGSIHGRHLSFEPRVELALSIADHYIINAATDASDSLSLDLATMISASGCGVDLDLRAIPVSPDVRTDDKNAAYRHALIDGEDFELILSVPPDVASRIMADPRLAKQLTMIGVFTDRHVELRSVEDDGSWTQLNPQGYIH